MVVYYLSQEERELLKQETQFFKRIQNKRMNTSDNTSDGDKNNSTTVLGNK